MAGTAPYPPGTFCWPELATTDQQSALRFYRALFGWTSEDIPGKNETYSMLRLNGKDVGAAYTMRPEERQHGAPPHWNAYIAVAKADDAVAAAQRLGAKVLAPPFDVSESGRMAALQDPTGAVFHVWEARKHIGAKAMNEPGALCWTELTTSDTAVAEKFYTKLFGWTPKHGAAGAPMEYTEFSIGGTPSIGMMPKPAQMPAHIPSYWMPYFQVSNVDQSTSTARELGAKAMVGPTDIPDAGRFVIMNDPQGAMFALFARR